jgi:DNA polymerase III delta prime subunit
MFESVPGQERPKRYFAEVLEQGPGHAYLLVGDEGLGKRAFACELARALAPAFRGCGACASCEELGRDAVADPNVLRREGESIRVEQIKALIADLGLRSFDGSRRVWLVPEAEAFNVQAANTFLKSLEEPPADVVFILVSSRLDRMLPTIVSRCQVVEFRPGADGVLAAYLEQRCGLGHDEAVVYARLARGSIDRALRLIDDRTAGAAAEDGADARESLRDRYLRLAASVVFHDRDAERRFVDEVAGAEAAAAARVEQQFEGRAGRLRESASDDRDQAWRLKALEGQARRETQRAPPPACLDALDHLASWLHDVWAVGLGGEDVVWNRDHVADLRHGSVARPDLYARLLDVVGETRKDVYLNVDRGLALRAMFARFEEVWEGA